MQYRGLREIAERMRWKSPATVLRRHKMDQFPMYSQPTQRGPVWVTSDLLIEDFERKKADLNQGMRLRHPPYKRRHKPTYKPYNYRLRNQNRIGTETADPTIKQAKKLPLHEELRWDSLQPGEKAYIKACELTPEELEEIERYEAKQCADTTPQPDKEGAQPGPQVATPQPRIINPIAEVTKRVAIRHFERRKRSRG